MPKYYIVFNKIPNCKYIIDAKDEQSAVEKAMNKMASSSEEIIEWLEKNDSQPMVAVSVSETGFVDFPNKMEDKNDHGFPEW